MPKDFERTRRVGEQLQRELAGLIQFELKDPRLGMVTISGVDVSKDLGHARVYISVLKEQDKEGSVEALQHAAGFLQKELGRRLSLRHIPKLNFIYDDTTLKGTALSSLIDDAIESDRKRRGDDDGA